MLRNLNRIGRIGMAALLAVFLGTAPATAAASAALGSFSYTAAFERLLYSREFTASERGFIHVGFTCDGHVGQSYNLALQKRTLGVWGTVGSRNHTCAGGDYDTAVWLDVSSGSLYRIKFSKPDTNWPIEGSGVVTY
ncbi:hypothetical protein ACO229_07000 [Promicromonospora sp. MS192]|uniref:hypothetical protein n=1 Tax=Promicromonospora sp. MS192 TaxID=3412684 RepID=UPI003C2F2775